jgi:uncharacterized protein YfaS (alpha-2-macroglobulin family)
LQFLAAGMARESRATADISQTSKSCSRLRLNPATDAATWSSSTISITASNTHEGDAVEETFRVHADGEPRDVAASGLLRFGSTTLTPDLPLDSIPGSVHAELMLYPNLRTHLMHAMKAVLERPYGCGEQTISSTCPSLLFLELLKDSGATSSAQNEAQAYLQLGYDRLLGYFDPSGPSHTGVETTMTRTPH